MKKLLIAGGVLVLALVAALLWQLKQDPVEVATVEKAGEKVASLEPSKNSVANPRSAAVPGVKPVDETADDSGKPKKLDPQSDAFFLQFDEMVPKKLTMAAAECYTGGLNRKHRNQHLNVSFDNVIKDGKVYVQNMKMLDKSNLNDPEMEQCMMKKMSNVVWQNDSLPDGVWPDQLKITPERGMKKYTKENMDYEGDGPIGKAVMTSPDQPAPISDSATKTDFDNAEQKKIEAGGVPDGVKK